MRAKLLYLASTLISAIAAALLGCGSLDGHTGTPGALATIQGALSDPSGYMVRNEVRVAVVWRNPSGGGYIVSEDLPAQPVFPSSFVVKLDGPPPAAALAVVPGVDVPVAEGVVVVYADLNGNGKLDLVPSDAGAFIDRIVGANESLYLVYIGGPVPKVATQDSVGTPTPGYNLVQKQFCQVGRGSGGGGGGSSVGTGAVPPSGSGGAGPAPLGSSGGTEAGAPAEAGVTANDGGTYPRALLPGCTPTPAEWLPMTHPYDLTVSSDPQVNQIMCENGGSGGSGGTGSGTRWNVGTQGTPPGGYPSSTDPDLTCQGSTDYFYQQCVTAQQGFCGPTFTTCTSLSVYLGSASRPPGWPCP
jgi:hypothetical protein